MDADEVWECEEEEEWKRKGREGRKEGRGEGGSRSEREENVDPDSLTPKRTDAADGVLCEDERGCGRLYIGEFTRCS